MSMRPPLSPRETRRSVRRTAPSGSSSTSKSPHSPPPDAAPPAQKKDVPRPVLSTSNSSARNNRRFKQEDLDSTVAEDPDKAPVLSPTVSNSATAPNGSRAKRKPKEKPQMVQDDNPTAPEEQQPEEEQGVTRCVCGSAEDDPDAGEFMVQCETCQVWQHGLCMGYASEDKLNASLLGASYFCELCSPELHGGLLQKLSKKARHSSIASTRNSVSAPSRLSRSHSPAVSSKQPHKRRNTMNSRFDDNLQEIIEATAAEAAAAHDPTTPGDTSMNGAGEDHETNKRKRTADEDAPPLKKRTRSASSASERHPEETPAVASGSSTIHKPPAPSRSHARNNKRRKPPAPRPESIDGEAPPPPPPKRTAAANRSRASAANKRSAAATADSSQHHHHQNGAGGSSTPMNGAASGSNAHHDHGTRRNPTNSNANGHNHNNGGTSNAGGGGGGAGASGNGGFSALEASRAYRASHAYIVSQQPLYTSWNLPDYLPQLSHMLPTEVPVPLQVRAGGLGGGVERSSERGVKVKWPSKRMSVGDMNKRVRALSEWVGREQSGAMDRGRRRDALSAAFAATQARTAAAEADDGMALDQPLTAPLPISVGEATPVTSRDGMDDDAVLRTSTMRLMEGLMEELISFQERFGPGVRMRERRLAAAS